MKTITRIATLAALGLVAQGALAGITQEEADRLGGDAITFEDVSAGPVDVDLIINATSVSAEDESPEFAALVAGFAVGVSPKLRRSLRKLVDG